jgi:hypothetical protein
VDDEGEGEDGGHANLDAAVVHFGLHCRTVRKVSRRRST